MNVLIIYAHPNPKSFCHAILETAVSAFKGRGHEVHVRDLYAMNFNPILSAEDFMSFKQGITPTDIALEQHEIRWAQLIVIINPVWWTSTPAILKGYFDRVYSYGFAFGPDAQGNMIGLLKDKHVYIFNTLGNSEAVYGATGMLKSITQTISSGVFEYSAMKVLGHKYFASVTSITQDERTAMLEEVKQLIVGLSFPSASVGNP